MEKQYTKYPSIPFNRKCEIYYENCHYHYAQTKKTTMSIGKQEVSEQRTRKEETWSRQEKAIYQISKKSFQARSCR